MAMKIAATAIMNQITFDIIIPKSRWVVRVGLGESLKRLSPIPFTLALHFLALP